MIHKTSLLTLLLCALLYLPCKGGNNTQPATTDTSAIRIMTWNLEMLPRVFFFLHHKPIIRARLIPAHIIKENTDIVVIQEAFDRKADRILKRKLKAVYPYIIGPVNRKPGFKSSSGVMVFSKYPLQQLETIQFTDCEGDDCWARKGAILTEAVIKGKKIQLAATHMNAGRVAKVKLSQYNQMSDMLKRHAQQNVPQIIAGDFNTLQKDSFTYNAMINIFEAENGPFTGDIKYTSDGMMNDMFGDYLKPGTEQDNIDYILYKANGKAYKTIMRTVKHYTQRWSKQHVDLTDHQALIMEVEL